MSAEEEPPAENEEEVEAPESAEEAIEEDHPKILKKRQRKGKIIMEQTAEADEEQLLMEITELLKRARIALVKKNYLEAVKSYQEAAIAANMAGDSERERIFLRRMNEILKAHPELVEEEGFKLIKKRKMKTKLREEEKFSFSRLISNILVAGLMIALIYGALLIIMFVQQVYDIVSLDLIPILWGVGIFLQILGIILAYLLGTRWLRWPE